MQCGRCVPLCSVEVESPIQPRDGSVNPLPVVRLLAVLDEPQASLEEVEEVIREQVRPVEGGAQQQHAGDEAEEVHTAPLQLVHLGTAHKGGHGHAKKEASAASGHRHRHPVATHRRCRDECHVLLSAPAQGDEMVMARNTADDGASCHALSTWNRVCAGGESSDDDVDGGEGWTHVDERGLQQLMMGRLARLLNGSRLHRDADSAAIAFGLHCIASSSSRAASICGLHFSAHLLPAFIIATSPAPPTARFILLCALSHCLLLLSLPCRTSLPPAHRLSLARLSPSPAPTFPLPWFHQPWSATRCTAPCSRAPPQRQTRAWRASPIPWPPSLSCWPAASLSYSPSSAWHCWWRGCSTGGRASASPVTVASTCTRCA